MGPKPPRYRALADRLRAAIQSGEYPPGAPLPTEQALRAAHGVSRHTAREALRLLQDDGLIERRRGAGTTVAAAPPRFAQTLGGLDDLLQYARAARLQATSIVALHPTAAAFDALELDPGVAWALITGVRAAEGQGPPIAATRIAVRAALAPTLEDLAALDGAINDWILRAHGVPVAAIHQSIAAVALSEADAAALHAAPGSPALKTVRRYMDGFGALIQASESVHPGDRFVYSMDLKRAP